MLSRGGPSATFNAVRSRLHDGHGRRYTMEAAVTESLVPRREACDKVEDVGDSSGELSDLYENDGDSSCNSICNELHEKA